MGLSDGEYRLSIECVVPKIQAPEKRDGRVGRLYVEKSPYLSLVNTESTLRIHVHFAHFNRNSLNFRIFVLIPEYAFIMGRRFTTDLVAIYSISMVAAIETSIFGGLSFYLFLGQITHKVAYRRQTNNILSRHVGFLWHFVPCCKHTTMQNSKF